jgi:non-specific serine/threonine protein kinase
LISRKLFAGSPGSTRSCPARAAYKARLVDLRDELQEAEDANDVGRIERTRAEIELISGELAAAVGLGGRSRVVSSAAERGRSTVTKGIKSAIEKIGAANPRAGRYFARTIRTGFLCSYQPDPDERITWKF